MFTKEQSFAHFTELVAQFRADEPNMLRMPEAQLERNYVLEFLRYLNWNVDGVGLTVSQLEVLFQKTDLRGKWPDWLLRLAFQNVLNGEIKNAGVDLHLPAVLH
jgi:hypothetical protein